MHNNAGQPFSETARRRIEMHLPTKNIRLDIDSFLSGYFAARQILLLLFFGLHNGHIPFSLQLEPKSLFQ